MTTQSGGTLSQQSESNVSWLNLALCTGLFGILCARSLFLQHLSVHRTAFQDDAYYYFLVARHLVSSGQSTFDGITLTNGYHPLWLGIVALQYWLFGPSMLLTRCIEFALGFGALWSLLLVANLPGLLLNLLYTTGLFAVISMFAFNGMETTAMACSRSLPRVPSQAKSPPASQMAAWPPRPSPPASMRSSSSFRSSSSPLLP